MRRDSREKNTHGDTGGVQWVWSLKLLPSHFLQVLWFKREEEERQNEEERAMMLLLFIFSGEEIRKTKKETTRSQCRSFKISIREHSTSSNPVHGSYRCYQQSRMIRNVHLPIVAPSQPSTCEDLQKKSDETFKIKKYQNFPSIRIMHHWIPFKSRSMHSLVKFGWDYLMP